MEKRRYYIYHWEKGGDEQPCDEAFRTVFKLKDEECTLWTVLLSDTELMAFILQYQAVQIIRPTESFPYLSMCITNRGFRQY